MGLVDAPRGLGGRAPRCVPRRDRRARRRAPLLPAHVRRAERRGHPDRAQGRHLDEGDRDDGGLEDPQRVHAGLRLDRRRAREGRGPLAPRKDEHGRVRDGLLDRELGLGAVAQSVGSVARPRRIGRRHRRCGLGRARALGPRLRHGRLDQAAVCAVRQRRPAADVRDRLALRVVAFASSLDQIGPVAKTVRDVALLYSIIAGRDPLDSTTAELPEAVQLPESDSLAGVRLAVPEAGRRRWTRSSRAFAPRSRLRSSARASSAPRWGSATSRSRTATGCRATTSSRRPRRRRTSRATTACATGRASRARRTARWSTARATKASAPSRSAASCSARTRSAAGYYDAFYGQAQKVRTLLIREHREALAGFDAIVTPTSPTVAFPIGDKAADPLAMYACDLLTIPSCLAGLPGLSIPCGLSDGLPVGLQLIGRQFGENGLFRVGHALEQAHRLRHRPGAAAMTLGAGDRAGDPRAAEDADEDVLPLRRSGSARGRTRRPARSASASRARCR